MKEAIPKSIRISKLIDDLFLALPEIEVERAVLLTKSYKETEHLPIILRRSKAFSHILRNIPITIRPHELIVGSASQKPRGCQVFPEFSFKWLEDELDTIQTRTADPFCITEKNKEVLREVYSYWKGKTTSELATSYMSKAAIDAMEANIFTAGNYYYNGIGHVAVLYEKVIEKGYEGIIDEIKQEMTRYTEGDIEAIRHRKLLEAMIESCESVIAYAKRYALKAREEAEECSDPIRKQELMEIAKNCMRVPAKGATSFYEACQSFWFVQMLIQIESSGHSISPGRFDQYMYPYYIRDKKDGKIDDAFAQELIDCIWVKLNDLNKVRDAKSAEGFAGYGLFQNLIVGGQTEEGRDATNELSYMCIEASRHTMLPQPSLSIRVWNGSPHNLLVKAAELTRTGIGLPAYYNDEVIIPSLLNRGLSLKDARTYSIIGCVEPQKAGKTDGWHDAAFFNMCRPLELVFSNGYDKEQMIGPQTGKLETLDTYEKFVDAYRKQMDCCIALMVHAINAIDVAHRERCPLPFLSCMVEDCIKEGLTVQEGGARYNFTGPQGFGIANIADSMYAIKKIVYEEQKISLSEYGKALENNYGKGITPKQLEKITEQVVSKVRREYPKLEGQAFEEVVKAVVLNYKEAYEDKGYMELLNWIETLPKFGNDRDDVDLIARDIAYMYTKPLQHYKNSRGGSYQAGLYPVSANVPLGAQTGATPDGRLAYTPIADGVSPTAGKDISGPTAAANSVAKLDHGIASNGTLFNQKFHPSALSNQKGINNFVHYIRSYFDQKGSHIQFNVVSREELIKAQEKPDEYKGLVVRVAGYSALFTTLSKSLQDDIINRTEQKSI